MKSALCSWWSATSGRAGLLVVIVAMAMAGMTSRAIAQTFTYTLSAGFLYEPNSTTDTVPPDSLLLLVDTGTGSLGSLTAGGSVVDGGMLNSNSVVLQQFPVGDGLTTPGTLGTTPNETVAYSSSVRVGDNLAIVWLPELTLGSTTLTAGLNYGSFMGVAGTDGSAWVIPADSGDPLNPTTINLNFTTDALSGNTNVHPESQGEANSLVLEAVPEPASYALICGVAALGLAVLRVRGRSRNEV